MRNKLIGVIRLMLFTTQALANNKNVVNDTMKIENNEKRR